MKQINRSMTLQQKYNLIKNQCQLLDMRILRLRLNNGKIFALAISRTSINGAVINV